MDLENLPHPIEGLDEDVALRAILEGTAMTTGEDFFTALVNSLKKVLNTHGAWVTEYIRDTHRLKALAFNLGDDLIHDFEFDIVGTPCETVVESDNLVHFSDRLIELYPNDGDIEDFGAVSYMGLALRDTNGKVMGHLAVVDTRPMPEDPKVSAIFKIFADRASAELQRLRIEHDLRERELKLGRMLDSAMDAIIELDEAFCVSRVNPAAEHVFGCRSEDVLGEDFSQFLTSESREKLIELMGKLGNLPIGEQYLWISGGLHAQSQNGQAFQAEATLSHFDVDSNQFYSLILRNINQRIEAEETIQLLTEEREYLIEEIKDLSNFNDILGTSDVMQAVIEEIRQVADTDSTVLILGETGTGKELIARAVHAESRRKDKPLIRVNCAAIPAALMESEFFGHEKGAFTGATEKRDGRFALADGGTIFLDEVGELPLDMQVKLLRVLQEGEFESVGSSTTQSIDVRVIAATNINPKAEIKAGRLREDLYYRLNVFPLNVPPLRDRDDDVILLAETFAQTFAQRNARTIEPLTEACKERLKRYNWPGNVRELQNVIDRAVITSRNNRLNLDRALPGVENCDRVDAPIPSEDDIEKRVMTVQEMQDMEKQNIIRALDTTDWRVSGDNGAASLLGMKPSTLSSRIKALGIERTN